MFAAVIFGYLVTTLLAFCGLVNVCCVLIDGNFETKAQFGAELSAASWPLGVAAIVFLLVQIACMLEGLKIRGFGNIEASASTKNGKNAFATQMPPPPPSASGQFFRADPQPTRAPEVAIKAVEPADDTKNGVNSPKVEPNPQHEKDQKPVAEDAGLGFFRVN